MRSRAIFILAALTASTASAQVAPPTPGGPLVLERIHDGWVVAPDFKITDFDSRTGELAGVYGGRLFDNTVLIGGAGYWLPNRDRDFKLAYGGVVVGWQSRELGRIRFGGRGLVGAGRATLGIDLTPLPTSQRVGDGLPFGDIRFGAPSPGVRGPASGPATPVVPVSIRARRVIAQDDFVVFEPQATISARLVKAIGVSCGIGYRATAEADILRDHLNGPSANIAVQFGW